MIAPARPWDTGPRLAAQTRSQSIALCHYGLAQRWLVVHAPAALERAEATGTTARQRAEAGIAKPLLHLQAQRFTTPQVAQDALVALAKRWTYQQVAASTLIEHTRYACTGRPTPPSPLKAIAWHSQARVRPAQEGMEPHKQAKAGCVLGPNMSASAWCDAEVIVASKGQSWVEGGVRFLTAPLFLVSSLLVKKPRRIEGLWMVMPLALLVYAVAQRRLRQP